MRASGFGRRQTRIDAVAADGWTPLHLASYRGDPDAVRFLVKSGADVHRRDDAGLTPRQLKDTDRGTSGRTRDAPLCRLLRRPLLRRGLLHLDSEGVVGARVRERQTVEVRRDRLIVQCRGERNKWPGRETVEILRRWAAKENRNLTTWL